MQNRKVIALLVVSVILASFLTFSFASSPSTTMTLSSGIYPGAPSYTVYTVGSNYYAKDQNGIVDYKGTDADVVIQAALDGLTSARTWKETVALKGYFPIDTTLKLHDYTIFDLTDAVVYMEDNSNTYMITNYGFATGATNDGVDYIDIIGGILDHNDDHQTVPSSVHTIWLKQCNYVNIEGVTVKNSQTWALLPDNCTNVDINGFKAYSTEGTQDGIHVYNGHDINIVNGLFSTGDDCICVEAEATSVYNINIANIYGTSVTANGLKFFISTNGLEIYNVNVNNYVVDAPAGMGIHFVKDGAVSTYAFRDIDVKNFKMSNNTSNNGIDAALTLTRCNIQASFLNPANNAFHCTYANQCTFDIQAYNIPDSVVGVYIEEAYDSKFLGIIDYVNTPAKTETACFWLEDGDRNEIHLTTTGGSYGVVLGTGGADSVTYTMVTNCLINGTNSGSIYEYANSNYNLFENNIISSPSAAITVNGGNTLTHHNVGWITEAGSTIQITSGNTNVDVTYACNFTPLAQDIDVHPITTSDSDYIRFWVGNIQAWDGAGTFTIYVASDPGASGVWFAWSVRQIQ